MRAGLRLLFNGDASQWDRAMQLPHYNTRSMPAVSVHTGLHLIQVAPACWLLIRGQCCLAQHYPLTGLLHHVRRSPAVLAMSADQIQQQPAGVHPVNRPAACAQWIQTGRFRLYDHGSRAANRRAYGEAAPPDIAEGYRLINIPVDLVAGKADGVIAPDNVEKHARLLREAGREVGEGSGARQGTLHGSQPAPTGQLPGRAKGLVSANRARQVHTF